jgi:hypothetical protein
VTPFVKWLQRFWEKTIGTWNEGPDAPPRIRDMAITFANEFPQATREEWVKFATDLASVWYRQGYIRGFQYVERLPIPPYPGKLPPELVADQTDPDWRWRPAKLVVERVLEPYEPPADDVNAGIDLDEAWKRQHADAEEEADD